MILGIPIFQKLDPLDSAAAGEIFDSMKSYKPELRSRCE